MGTWSSRAECRLGIREAVGLIHTQHIPTTKLVSYQPLLHSHESFSLIRLRGVVWEKPAERFKVQPLGPQGKQGHQLSWGELGPSSSLTLSGGLTKTLSSRFQTEQSTEVNSPS